MQSCSGSGRREWVFWAAGLLSVLLWVSSTSHFFSLFGRNHSSISCWNNIKYSAFFRPHNGAPAPCSLWSLQDTSWAAGKSFFLTTAGQRKWCFSLGFYLRNMGKELRSSWTITPEKWDKSVLETENGRKTPLFVLGFRRRWSYNISSLHFPVLTLLSSRIHSHRFTKFLEFSLFLPCLLHLTLVLQIREKDNCRCILGSQESIKLFLVRFLI